MHPLRTSCHHLVQQLSQSPLPEVSDGRSRTLDRGTAQRTAPLALRSCRLYSAAATGATGSAEQKSNLWFAASCQRRNSSPSRSQPQTSRGRDRFLQRAAHLEPKAPAASPRPLRRPRRWTLARSHPLDSISPSLLSPHSSTPARVSRQVRRRSQVSLSTWPASSFRRSGAARATQGLRCLAAAAIPKRLDRLLQTTLRRPRVCTPVSRPLHSSRGHLQSSTGLVGRWPSHLSLARLGSPQ